MNGKNASAALVIIVAFCGCQKSPEVQAGLSKTPEQAASQMDEAFTGSDQTTKDLARAAAEAMRKKEYESAVVSLQTIRGNDAITPDQRLAIYSSAVSLEAQLISAMQAGDKNAERAYQLLKALKRN